MKIACTRVGQFPQLLFPSEFFSFASFLLISQIQLGIPTDLTRCCSGSGRGRVIFQNPSSFLQNFAHSSAVSQLVTVRVSTTAYFLSHQQHSPAARAITINTETPETGCKGDPNISAGLSCCLNSQDFVAVAVVLLQIRPCQLSAGFCRNQNPDLLVLQSCVLISVRKS